MKKIILLTILLLSASIHAATYCVNQTGGSDSNNGACATPWATVRKAMLTVVPNDVVVIGPGTYNEYVIASNSLQTADDNVSYIGFGMPTIRLANVTCNRVVDVVNNNNSFDGITFDLNGTLDTCEYGVYIRNNKNDLTVKNSIIKNGVGATAAGVKVETSGVVASNNAIIYNNSFINDEYAPIDLTGGNSNNTNISNNYIEVGKTNADFGVYGTTSTGANSYNLTIANNNFAFNGTGSIEGYAIFLQRTTLVNSSYNTQIYNNTFGLPSKKWVGNIMRIVRQQESNFSNNTIWFNDTLNNPAIWYEGNNTNGTFTYNTFCNATELCSASGNGLTFADVSYFLVDHNTAYFDKVGDAFWTQGQTKIQLNNNVSNNYLYVYNTSVGGHAIGLGSEGSGYLMNNSYVFNNILNVTVNTSGIMHGLFIGNTQNSFATNNTLIGGDYGLLSKLNVNATFDTNQALNISFVGMYDKGSNNTVFKNNRIEVSNFTQFVTDNDGTTYPFRTKDITYYNNTIIYHYSSGMKLIPFRRGANSENVTEYNNTFYLPYRSYPAAFQNASTNYNYLTWQTTFSTESNSLFYPNDTVTLSLTNNTYYNGNNWLSVPIINGISIANATFYLNYSNGTNYLTLQNTTTITNATNYTFQAQINTTDNFTWNVCYKDPNSFTTCGANWYAVKSDVITPTLTINLPANNTNQSSTTLTINFSATDETPLFTCWYSINNTANVTVNGCVNATTNQTTTTVTQGDNQNITIYANDSAGNTISATRTFNIDTTAPTLTINSPVNNTNQSSTTLTLNFSATDAHDISTCWYTINNTANTTMPGCLNATTNETNITVSTGANQNITIYANDTLGNIASALKTFNIETAAPITTINLPANNTNQTSTTLTLNFSAYTQNTLDTCMYSINNTANTTISGCINSTTNQTNINVAEGANQNITLYINDTAGHLTTTTQYFTIDNTPPILTINLPANNTNQTSTTLTINFSATDSITLDTCGYNINNTINVSIPGCINATTNQTTATVSVAANQNITIYANDTLGNFNSTTYIFTITETTTPAPSSGSGGGGGGGASITTTNNTQNNTAQNSTQNNPTNQNILRTIKPPTQKTTNKTFNTNNQTIQNNPQINPTINKENYQLQPITIGIIIAAALLGIIIFAKLLLH